MLVPVFALVIALLIPVQNVGVGGCEDVHIIGVRGSGQIGYGDQVGSVVTDTAASVRRTGRSVIAHSLDYPAISISDSFGLALLNGDYSRSVTTGVDALRSDLDTIRNVCPDTQVVLVGYSQGSQVIKNAVKNRPPVDRIAAVALLADPTRDVTQPGIVRLGSGLEGSGAFGSVTLPNHLRTVAIDVCAVGDGVCGTGGFLSHIEGYEELAPPIILHILRELAASPLRYFRAA
jgi:cutinase